MRLTAEEQVGEPMYGRTIPVVTVDAETYARLRTGDWPVVDAVADEVRPMDAGSGAGRP